MSDFSFNQSSPVASYVDEVYRATQPSGRADFRPGNASKSCAAPGTLYGKNSTGGAVNFIAQAPNFERGGYLTLGPGITRARRPVGRWSAAGR